MPSVLALGADAREPSRKAGVVPSRGGDGATDRATAREGAHGGSEAEPSGGRWLRAASRDVVPHQFLILSFCTRDWFFV